MRSNGKFMAVLAAGILLLSASVVQVGFRAVRYEGLVEASSGVPFQKGMSFTVWQADGFNTPFARQELRKLRDLGVDWVCINHWWFQDYLNSTEIKKGPWSDDLENLTACFQYARSIGLHVFYKPMLNLLLTYDWRSNIVYTPEWMESYTSWLVENAKAAEAGGVELLSIGTEMGSMQVHSSDVRDMIARVRAVYTGLLTYSANHDSYGLVDWWDAVDVIGISMYTPMTIAWDPSVDQLQATWDGMYEKLEQLALRWQRPVLFAETGIQARDGSSMIPNDNQISDRQDVSEMRNFYLSLFRSKIWTAPWFKGAHWWIWDGVDPETDPGLNGFNPVLINDTIREMYGQERQETSPLVPLVSSAMTLFMVAILLFMVAFVSRTRSSRATVVTREGPRDEHGPGDRKSTGILESMRKVVPGMSAPVNDGKNAIVTGLLLGCLMSVVSTGFTMGLFNLVHESFSYAIILKISIAGLFTIFGLMLLAGTCCGLLLLRWRPRHGLHVAVFLLSFRPFAAGFVPGWEPYIGTFLDFLSMPVLVACIVDQVAGSRPVQAGGDVASGVQGGILALVVPALLVFAGFLGMVLVAGSLAPAFLSIPLGAAMVLRRPARRGDALPAVDFTGKADGNLDPGTAGGVDPASHENVGDGGGMEEFPASDAGPPKLRDGIAGGTNVLTGEKERVRAGRRMLGLRRSRKVKVEMLVLLVAFLAGMLVPLGNSVINLINMSLSGIAWHYIPAALGALVFAVVFYLLGRKELLPGWLGGEKCEKFMSHAGLLVLLFVVGLAGFPFMLAGSLTIVWAILSGLVLYQLIGVLGRVTLARHVTNSNRGGAFALLYMVFVFFALGFILNGAKGLLVYVVTFLVFKDGAISIRDPLVDPVTNFDVPFFLNSVVLGIALFLATLGIVFRLVSRKLARGRTRGDRASVFNA